MNANTKVDWTKVPAGTMIHVRDYVNDYWNVREFKYYDATSIVMPYMCKPDYDADDDIIVPWTQAELIEDQPEVTEQKPSVKFEGDNVLVPVTTYLKITASEYGLIQKLYPNNKVSIIKFIREVHKFGLVETKKICDTICGLNNSKET